MSDKMNTASDLLSAPSSNSGFVVVDDNDVLNDCSLDGCSICLEPFTSLDPPSVTKCKHEYHLHCILDWCQRRVECPVCLQHLVFNDPVSQELLASVEREKNLKLRRTFNPTNQGNENSSHVNEADKEQPIMRHFNAIANRARNIARRRREMNLPASPSEILPSVLPTDRFNSSQSSSYNPGKLSPSDLAAFSESLKSKISTASVRYKESISKSTHSLKEKIIARNDSVKELSREVHREMSAGIAGIARMISQKRAGFSDTGETSQGMSSDSVVTNSNSGGFGVSLAQERN